jgi:anti-sigma28 factor (negative regulator of flagellin synthesis)
MVDPIKGPGTKIIITKSQPKERPESSRNGDFGKVMRDKGAEDSSGVARNQGIPKGEANLALLNQQKLAHMQKFEAVARAIREGTYQMADAEVLAEKLMQAMFDKKTRDKFLRKVLDEEIENAHSQNRPLSDLELKKLVFLMKDAVDGNFEDPELEQLLQEFS